MAVITPAPAQTGVSYNAFTRFNVNAAGAQFQNTAVQARTIVAEVFSPLPSRIEGPVSVDGPRANLIIANQNGLRVNGGSFVNFGSLALTTGSVTLRDAQLAPTVMQRFVDVSTRQGDIQIGPGGLDANVIRLELIAKRVGISGAITNAFSSPTALTRIVAGTSVAQFDTVASPTDNLTPWVAYTPGHEQISAIAIDVNAGSTVTSGRIEVLVTDQGAGVRNAGRLTASAGDFILNTAGRIEQIGGEFQALGNLRMQAASLNQSSNGGTASLIAAGGAVSLVVTGDLVNEGGTIRGATRAIDDPDHPYAVFLKAGGNILHQTAHGAPGAVIFGSGDDVALLASGSITVQDARVVSNAGLEIRSDDIVRNETLVIAGAGRTDWRGGNVLAARAGYSVDLGAVADPEHQGYLVAENDLSVRARDIQNIGGHIFTNNGSVSLNAARTLTTQGLAVGTYGYKKSCFLFLCKRVATTTETLVGGQIQAAADISLQAGLSVLNDGGNVFAAGNLTVVAPEIIARGHSLHTVILRADGVKAMLGETWAGIYAADQGGGFTAQQGRLILQGNARQERGTFNAAQGIEGNIDIIELPARDPVTLDDHIGVLSW
ncbi:MAG: filamentous hemagglutinin family outer membrane protein [Rhodoferax sp.]|nr:filamentous hemagglutinin family outer membrane protein [Rhodoferax sp.]